MATTVEDLSLVLRTLVEALPTPTLVVDAAGSIEELNGEASELLGYAREELEGQSIGLLVPEPHRGAHAKLVRSFFDRPSKRPMGPGRELTVRRKDGVAMPVEIGLSPLAGFPRRLALVTVIDISVRKHASEQFRRYAQRLERRNRELEEFAAATAEEVRDPLRTIASLAQPDRGGRSADATNADLRRIEALSKQSLRFVDDLLTLAQWSYGDEPDTLVDLNDVVAGVLEDVGQDLRAVSARVQVQALPTVHGHVGRFHQLFRILVEHAIQSRREDAPLEIQVFCEPDSQHSPSDHQLIVANNGIGFDDEDLRKVFSPFRRLRAGTAQETTGARFLICRGIVEALHGDIALTSIPGKGDRFLIRLPRAGRIEQVGRVEDALRNPDLVIPAVPGLETIKLLMVIGQEHHTRPLRELLREAAYTRFEVEWVNGVTAGIQAVVRWDYDLCLVEHEIPHCDGLAFLRDPACVERSIPTLLVLDHEDRDLAFAAIRSGAADVLVWEQFGATELERALRYAVDRNRLRREIDESRQRAARARELRAIERMGTNTRVPHTARAFGSATIQEAVSESFQQLTTTFETLLNAAVEERVLKIDHDLADAYDTLARRIGFLGGGPRDTVQLFTEVLKRKAKTANPPKLRVYTEEARLILLEVMGRLVSYYRTQAVGARAAAGARGQIGSEHG